MENKFDQKSETSDLNNLGTDFTKFGLSAADISQIKERNIPLENIENQLRIFRKGIVKVRLERAATVGDGILKLNKSELERYGQYFDQEKSKYRITRFIPASGAASRMFQFLSEFLNDFDLNTETIENYISRSNGKELHTFVSQIEEFPFYQPIADLLKKLYPEAGSWDAGKRHYHFIKLLLQSEEFGYASKPKGVLPFHRYKSHTATAVEEHLAESIYFGHKTVGLHFTVSENHLHLFEEIISEAKNKIEQQHNIKIETSFSNQDQSTDTIAVTPDNLPFRNDNGALVFRPGGHGALLQNMDKLEADLIFIQNIDNVIHRDLENVSIYKKVLCGVLLELQQEVFAALKELEKSGVTDQQIEDLTLFITHRLGITLPPDFTSRTQNSKTEQLKKSLNRPIRVCGMVENEGEPGGGPFWISDKYGQVSLQIVESSQVDIDNVQQKKILKSATHFNPVDLVCAPRNFKGEKFALQNFIDPESGFIVEKSKDGRPLKGYELPGLWNGAMANWITVFVEVPLITFNPVKTVNDLLKPTHQPQSGH